MNIEVKVIAGARKRAIMLEGSLLKVKILSKPLKGKANEELIEYISDTLGIKRKDVAIVAGQRDTRKVISIPVDEETLIRVLAGRP
ncbi:MAG: DUF167 domain-containing protein [Syntrophorhabdales bacterium]